MSEHLVTTKAQPGLCPIATCQALVLAGVSEGLHVRVDPHPVPPEVEALAVLAGRGSFSLHDGRLVARLGNSFVPGPVLITHRCGYVLRAPPAPPAAPEAFVPPF